MEMRHGYSVTKIIQKVYFEKIFYLTPKTEKRDPSQCALRFLKTSQ